MKKIIVTGATGFVGSHLIPRLISLGHETHAICRSQLDDTNALAGYIIHTIHETQDVHKIFEKHQFDCVIHLATLYTPSPEITQISTITESNLELGIHILEGMKASGSKNIIFTTTPFEFDLSGAYRPNSLYAATKKAFKDICKYYTCHEGIKLVNLVLYDNYGTNDPRKKIANLIIEHTIMGNELKMTLGEQEMYLVHVSDTVNGILQTINQFEKLTLNKPESTFCLAGRNSIKVRELAETIENLVGQKFNAIWGALPYRANQLMQPWVGKRLPNWTAQVKLTSGMNELLDSYKTKKLKN